MKNLLRSAERTGPFLLVAVFLSLLLLDGGAFLAQTYRDGDAASGPVIAELLGARDGGKVVLGDYLWLEPLYLLRWIVWLPGHRQLGEALPFLFYALGVGAVAWSVAQAVGRRRALLVAAVLACPSPAILPSLATLNFHGLVLFHTAILGLVLVAFVQRSAGWSDRQLALVAVGAAVLTAPGLAGDQTLLVGGLLPFVVTVSVLAPLGFLPRRVVWAGWGAAVGALAGAGGLLAIASANHVVTAGKPFVLSTIAQLFSRAELFLEAFGSFTGGITGQQLELLNVVRFAASLVAIAVLFLAVRALRKAQPRVRELPPLTVALAVFWGVSVLGLFAAFISTDVVVDTTAVRYVLGAWPAVLLLLAVLVPGRVGERGLVVLVLFVAGMGIAALQRGEYDDNPSKLADGFVAGRLEQLVTQQHLDHGYGSYYSAANLTYASHFHAKVYPILPCGATACPFYLHRLDAWYRPKQGVKTFYVVDTTAPGPYAPTPPPDWQASQQVSIGQLQVYVYDYDVSTRFGPAG